MFNRLLFVCVSVVSCLAIFTGSAQAGLNLASGWPSGQWYNPARDGEGFYVEVIGKGENLQIAVAMYSYDEAGNQLWLVGNVVIADGDMGATVPVVLIEGPVWGTAYDPADRDTTQFGSIAMQFPTCDSAMFTVTSNVAGLESGAYSLVRLTEIVGMDCVEPPPPAPPPPDDPMEITPGLWTGSGVCFFVNDEGTQIVESDQCDNGKSLSADIEEGVQVNIDGYQDPGKCDANVACEGVWDIITSMDEYSGLPVLKANCVNDAGGAAHIGFYNTLGVNVAAVWVYDTSYPEFPDGRFCVGGGDDGIRTSPAQ